jgi:hypothetical protein
MDAAVVLYLRDDDEKLGGKKRGEGEGIIPEGRVEYSVTEKERGERTGR